MTTDQLRAALRAVLRDFDREPTEPYLDEAVRIFVAASAPDEGRVNMQDTNPRDAGLRVDNPHPLAVPALDVKRLADALARRFPGNDDFSDAAEYVAREYAAIAASATDEGPLSARLSTSHLDFCGGGEYCSLDDCLCGCHARPAVPALDVLPTFEVGQVVGDLQPGRRRRDWCSIHGDIGPMESIDAHARSAHGSSAEAIQKARKVLKRAVSYQRGADR